jgi:hypothetical protein
VITSLCFWSREGSKKAIALIQAMVMSVVIALGVQTPVFGHYARLLIMLFNMMVFIASTAQARARTRSRAQGRSRLTPFSGQTAGAQQRGLVIVHGLVTLFHEVIALVIILLVVGLAVPRVLVVASTTIMALISLMVIIWLAIIVVASVASMTVVVVATAMLAVA